MAIGRRGVVKLSFKHLFYSKRLKKESLKTKKIKKIKKEQIHFRGTRGRLILIAKYLHNRANFFVFYVHTRPPHIDDTHPISDLPFISCCVLESVRVDPCARGVWICSRSTASLWRICTQTRLIELLLHSIQKFTPIVFFSIVGLFLLTHGGAVFALRIVYAS